MIDIAVWIALGYLGAGFLFAIPFVVFGVQKVDPAASRGSWGFRVLLIPGAMAFWPMLLRRWIAGQQPCEERNAHRLAANDRSQREESVSL